jgi:hypothetical protein
MSAYRRPVCHGGFTSAIFAQSWLLTAQWRYSSCYAWVSGFYADAAGDPAQFPSYSFNIERSINGQSAERRRVVRQEVSAPLVAELEGCVRSGPSCRAATISPRRWIIC